VRIAVFVASGIYSLILMVVCVYWGRARRRVVGRQIKVTLQQDEPRADIQRAQTELAQLDSRLKEIDLEYGPWVWGSAAFVAGLILGAAAMASWTEHLRALRWILLAGVPFSAFSVWGAVRVGEHVTQSPLAALSNWRARRREERLARQAHE
jgi:hypothetical protein